MNEQPIYLVAPPAGKVALMKVSYRRGYELFKLIQLGGVNHLNAEMAEWQTHLTQNQASIPHVGSSPTFGTKDSFSNYINYKFMSSVQVRFYAEA